MQKRVAAIHDISCFGRCSLTVALPIISAAGIETAVIPTALLSTHTGGFKNYVFKDLTENILPIALHWESEKIKSDTVYTGYLGSKEQVEIVKETQKIIRKESSLLIVDPVMADFGRLYGGFDADFPEFMKKLCLIADVITPNITEACFLTQTEYLKPPFKKDYINKLLNRLKSLTKAKIVLTGVSFDGEKTGVACFDGKDESYILSRRINAAFHGTGDVFASALTAAMTKGKDLLKSAEIAEKFTVKAIKRTLEVTPDSRYGVDFEEELPYLIKLLREE